MTTTYLVRIARERTEYALVRVKAESEDEADGRACHKGDFDASIDWELGTDVEAAYSCADTEIES